jgi:hypothetical protein
MAIKSSDNICLALPNEKGLHQGITDDIVPKMLVVMIEYVKYNAQMRVCVVLARLYYIGTNLIPCRHARLYRGAHLRHTLFCGKSIFLSST